MKLTFVLLSHCWSCMLNNVILFLEEEPKSDKAEEPAESESEPSNAPAELELNPNSLPASTHSIINSPKVFSPLPAVVVDSRADEDLLGGMDIEQVSDEELEEEGKSSN